MDSETGTDASFVWSNITSTGPSGCQYDSIRLIGYGRTTGTSICDDEVAMRLGYVGEGSPDAGASSYGFVESLFTGNLASTGGQVGSFNKMKVGSLTCASEASNDTSGFEILIPNAFSTTYDKVAIGTSTTESEVTQDSTYGISHGLFSGVWFNNGAVAFVQVWPASAASWAAHSHVALYLE
jgi:hypothetical protein